MAKKKWFSVVLIVLIAASFPAGAATISGGNSHTLQVAADGSVRSWGNNNAGQLGDGSILPEVIPHTVPGLTSFTAVAACGGHSLGLKSDGTVWGWGQNNFGQLGDGTTTLHLSPVQATVLTGITAISCGLNHSVALKNDGTVWTWGQNSNGQIGDGSTNNQSTPTAVSGLSTMTGIGAGDNHTLALKSDGTVWAWGINLSGQLGDTTTTQRTTPVQVSGLTNVAAVAGGSVHSLALKTDHTVWGWGGNANGQLGDNSQNNRSAPVQVTGLTSVNQIEAGNPFSVALKSDGTVWAWGGNGAGQLGDGTFTLHLTPVQVAGLTNVLEVAAGAQFGLALQSGDVVVGWGASNFGALGNGEFAAEAEANDVDGISGVFTDVVAGGAHVLARKNDGTLWSWGFNANGQLGNGGFGAAAQVTGLTLVQAIGAGNNHSLAVKSDGTAWAWGQNLNGQIGDNSTTQRNAATQVSGLTGMTAVCGGNSHSLGLKNDGTVRAWGNNLNGQLGDGTTNQQLTPIQVPGLSGITAIACGASHSLALKNDGTVWAWGFNLFGQLGDGTNTQQLSPVQVSGLTGVIAIAASSQSAHSMALKSDHTVWAWGINSSGQLGTGNTTNSSTPVQSIGLAGVTSIAAGTNHSMAVTSDGSLWMWGLNNQAQLGFTTTAAVLNRPGRSLFDLPPGVTVTAVSGANHTVALMNDGSIATWGSNSASQLGRNGFNYSHPNFVTSAALGVPDLSLTMTHSGQFIVGRTGVYTLTVTNVGTSAFPGPQAVDDLLPPGMTYVSATGPGWTCGPQSGFIRCTNPGPFAAGSSSVITLTVKIGPLAFPSATNGAGIEDDDINPLNDIAADPTLIAPLPGGVTPAAGSALTQTFTFTFAAANGWQSISLVDVLINNALNGASACYVAVIPSGATTAGVYLVNDAGSSGGPYAPVAIPSAGTAANSQCTINGTGSSLSQVGNTMTLALSITFSGTFSGDKVAYMAVQDNTPVNSGWHPMGTWNVPGAAPVGPGVNPPTPARSTTTTQTFTFTFTDTLGFADISITNVLINDAINGVSACYMAIVPAASSVYLVLDGGSAGGPYSALALPGAGSATNSQCTINGAGSSIVGVGNNLTVTLNITFNTPFSGDRIIYAATRTGTGGNTGWRAIGTASVP